jgi:predicted NBD/HSP70 family sugar kinase
MIIGIDIGGYNINGVLVKNNKIVRRFKVLTKSKTNKKIIIGQIFNCIESLMLEGVEGIGIGVPGPIDRKGQNFFLNPPM